MKIDAGRLKNFKLKVIQKKTLRPTKSRIRNSIFDILDSRISFLDCNFFDLPASIFIKNFGAILFLFHPK